MNKSVVIIGGGFSGMLTAIHLVRQGHAGLTVTIVNPKESMATGVAYNPYSKKHLLNVVAGKMSAFASEPEHFLNWLVQQAEYENCDRNLLSTAFVPRFLYGEYLRMLWCETKQLAQEKKIDLNWESADAEDLDPISNGWKVSVTNGTKIVASDVVLASGNESPRHPNIADAALLNSHRYFQNPWREESVTGLSSSDTVLILGNGLTMVDTVIGLLEKGFNGSIYSLSPNGFNILPHRHGGLQYNALVNELPPQHISLNELFKLVHRHIKQVRQYGLSAEPVIDSLRPHTQRIWQQLSQEEKQIFISRFRHLWGVARHRIPTHIHDMIQQLRIEHRLHIVAGKIQQLQITPQGVDITYHKRGIVGSQQLHVSRIINCTGPETNLLRSENKLLRQAFTKGYLKQDELQLGIAADVCNFRVQAGDHSFQPHLYTLGGHLRGILWETTAVNELRTQAIQLAKVLLQS